MTRVQRDLGEAYSRCSGASKIGPASRNSAAPDAISGPMLICAPQTSAWFYKVFGTDISFSLAL